VNKLFCVIDGTTQIYRSFYAIKMLTTSGGFPTNAIYGFINILNKILTEFKPTYIAIAFDSPTPTFRHKFYPAYKATRPKPPDSLIVQISKIKEAINYMGITLLEFPGYEADDIIATIVKKFYIDAEFIIVASDKDIMQLVDEKVRLFDPKTEEYIDIEKVKQKIGVEPKLIPSYLALTGDSIDNITGLPGIGPKKAAEILENCVSIEQLLVSPEKIPPKYRELLIQNKKVIQDNLQLVTLKPISDFSFNLSDFMQKPFKTEKLRKLYTELEFRKFLKTLEEQPVQLTLQEKTTNLIQKVEPTKFLNPKISDINLFFNSQTRKIVISSNNFFTTLIDYEHESDTLKKLLTTKQVYTYNIKDILRNLNFFWWDNLKISDIYLYDTILDPGFPKKPSQLWSIYNSFTTSYSSDFDINFSFNLKNIAIAMEEKLIEKQKGLYTNIELPLSVILANMEKNGILVDKTRLKILGTSFKERTTELMEEIYKIAGEKFNIDSPKQLQTILYEKLKITPGRKTKTGYSTDAQELIRISNIHPIGKKLLEYRLLTKLITTYIDGFEKYISEDSKIHTTFIQGGTITGRLSTQEPNLQNIPIRTAEGKKIRSMFIASAGYNLLSLDYSQIELRVLAHLSNDKKLIEAFQEGKDIHTQTACIVFNKKEEEITEELRKSAKAINFGIIYGMGAHGLAEQLGISHSEAREFIESFFRNYPDVKKYIDTQLEKARLSGYVENMFGRIRYLPQIRSDNFHEKSAAERIAINTPIQGTAADITKLGMINLYSYFVKNNLDAKLLLQIHDEIIIEYNQDYKEDFVNLCKNLMTYIQGLKLTVPLSVKSSIGKSWGDL
jgi:DNA polymerase I